MSIFMSLRTRVRSLTPFLQGALGMIAVLAVGAVLLVGYHLWLDHQGHHQVIGLLNTLVQRHPELFK